MSLVAPSGAEPNSCGLWRNKPLAAVQDHESNALKLNDGLPNRFVFLLAKQENYKQCGQQNW